MTTSPEPLLSVEQAYEAAYRFVAQYFERERSSESLMLMLVSMELTGDALRTNDPASWPDWEKCVEATLSSEPLPDPSR